MAFSKDDGPFGAANGNSSIGVGFSDAALLVVSLCGFGLLAGTVYALVLARLKTKEEEEDDAERELDHDDYLIQANVDTLSRAERKARARALARRQNQNPEGHGAGVSRKDRHKLAKDIEREERKRFASQRREEQLTAQEAAQESKRERERLLAERMEEEKRALEEQKREKEQMELHEHLTFLSTDMKQSTVDDWIEELESVKGNVVQLSEVAEEFGVSIDRVRARLQCLVEEKRLLGVFEEDGRFVRVLECEVHDLLRELLVRHCGKGTVSNADIAALWNERCNGEYDDTPTQST